MKNSRPHTDRYPFKIVLLFICLTVTALSGAFCKPLTVDEAVSEILSLADGTSGRPVALTVKPTGTVTRDHWKKFDEALRTKQFTQVTLDFSGCTVGSAGEDKETEKNLFSNIDSLVSITFPEGLTGIGAWSFNNCKNLKDVFFPHTVVHSVGYLAFGGCTSLSEVHLYAFDGRLDECFQDCGTIAVLEVPGHPIYATFQGGYYQYAFGRTEIREVLSGSRKMSYEEWKQYCSDMYPKSVTIASAVATSEASAKYAAKNICDATWASWVEGKPDEGIGESIEMTFSEPTTISYLSIKNGFGNLAWYYSNNRPKDIEVIFDNDSTTDCTRTLTDTPLAQYESFDLFGKPYHKVKITIKSVYTGTGPDNDTCIAEIAVNTALQRTEQFGAVYDTGGLVYGYDPETARILKATYALDVGSSNVRLTGDGRVEIKITDSESGKTYWTIVNDAFEGTFNTGFFPGTGAGSLATKFMICLSPSGEHTLFTWHTSTGDFSNPVPDVKLHVYTWLQRAWVPGAGDNPDTGRIMALVSALEKRGIPYDFDITPEKTVHVYACAVQKRHRMSVEFAFPYDGTGFLPYIPTARNTAASGTPDDLARIADWKAGMNDTGSSSDEKTENLLACAAAFNSSPKMVRYLIDQGCEVNPFYDVNDDDDCLGSIPFTPMEACVAGKNTDAVQQVLLNAGAAYTPAMLSRAFTTGNSDNVRKFAPHIKDFGPALAEICSYYTGHNRSTDSLSYIKQTLSVFRENGCDLNGPYSNPHNRPVTLTGEAIQTGSPDLLKMLVSMGCSIPGKIMDTPVLMSAAYVYTDICCDDPDPEAGKRVRSMIDYLFDSGCNVNEVNEDGENELHLVCRITAQKNRTEMAELFIGHGIDVNLRNSDGETPLMVLYHNADTINEYTKELAHSLIAHGADVNTMNNDNETAAEVLLDQDEFTEGSAELLRLLLDNGFNASAAGSDGVPVFSSFCDTLPLMQIPYARRRSMFDSFIKGGAVADFKDNNGYTPLLRLTSHLDFFNENDDTWQLTLIVLDLIEKGASVTTELEYFLDYDKSFTFSFCSMLMDQARNWFEDRQDSSLWTTAETRRADRFVEIVKAARTHGGDSIMTEKALASKYVPQSVIDRIFR